MFRIAILKPKSLNQNPRQIAEQITQAADVDDLCEKMEIAGPGFINIKMKDDFWFKELIQILKKGEEYAKSKIGKRKKINIEFVS